MVKHEINVYLEPKLAIAIKKSWFISVIHKILNALDITIFLELGLVLTNNKVIKQLNKIYRKKNEPTDVITFCMLSHQDTMGTKFVAPTDGITHLGEIVISYPQAVYQAKRRKHDIERELIILMIHGILHLLGYDHEQSKKTNQFMKAQEKDILKKLGYYPSK